MAQDRGLVIRGMLLLAMIGTLSMLVLVVVFRQNEAAPPATSKISQREPSKDGWEVRYNATVALARRGSSKLPCDVLAEMLDEEQQLRNFLTKGPNGEDFLDEQAARRTVQNGLKALTEWLKHKDAVKTVTTENATGWQQVRAAVDKLTQSGNAVLRKDAEEVKAAIAGQ